MKQRGSTKPPKLAVGDGAMGFWSALDELAGDGLRDSSEHLRMIYKMA